MNSDDAFFINTTIFITPIDNYFSFGSYFAVGLETKSTWGTFFNAHFLDFLS